MDHIEIFEALTIEAAYDLCVDALGLLVEAERTTPANALVVAIVAILESRT